MGFYLDSVLSAEKRLNDPRNVAGLNYRTIGQGKSENSRSRAGSPGRSLSLETKGLVSALAQVSGVKETAKALNFPPVLVSRFKNGQTSNGTQPDPELRKEATSVLDRIGNQASSLVSTSLERLLDPSRLIDAKTSELTQIAAVAMGIVEKTQPKTNMFMAGRICFMVPPSREVSDYDIIDVEPVKE